LRLRQVASLLPVKEVESLRARNPAHPLESFDWDHGRQR
jgi:hypothetical protein